MNETPVKKHDTFLLCLFVVLSTFLLSCGGSSDAGSGDSKKPEDANRCKITVAATTGGKVKITEYLETTECVPVDSRIEVVATPDKGYAFTGWYVGDSSEPVSIDAVFTFVATRNSTLTAHFVKNSNTINGHEYVDLGLPSGLKWATCNVGANNPWKDGGYYAWGETEEKEIYDVETYKWCRGSNDNKMTKYCTDSYWGRVDNKTVLDPEDDVAHVKWGGSWRMPTIDEQRELLNECSWEWTELDGYTVTGPNGNSIFLPAAGCRNATGANDRGSAGLYWSSSLSSGYSYSAYFLCFHSDNHDWSYGLSRCLGKSVRPVSD